MLHFLNDIVKILEWGRTFWSSSKFLPRQLENHLRIDLEMQKELTSPAEKMCLTAVEGE